MKVKLSNPIKNKYGDPLRIGNGTLEVDEMDKEINTLLREGAIDPIYEEVKREIFEIPKEIIKPLPIIKSDREEKKIYTKQELKRMNKLQQVEILRGYGFIKIPSLESDRIELIINIQKKG